MLPRSARADVAQLVERVLGKDEVTGSTPVIGSSDPHRLPRDRRLPGHEVGKQEDPVKESIELRTGSRVVKGGRL